MHSTSDLKVTPLLLKRSIITMLIVGTVLNVINQPAALFGDQTIAWSKLLLTYAVPFSVSMVSGILTLKECKEDIQR